MSPPPQTGYPSKMAPLAFQVDQGPSDGETPPWQILIQNERNQINAARNQQGGKNLIKLNKTNKQKKEEENEIQF